MPLGSREAGGIAADMANPALWTFQDLRYTVTVGEAKLVSWHQQWTPTEMPRIRQAMVEQHQQDLDQMAHPGVRDFLRRERVGTLNELTSRPVTDAAFDAELTAQIGSTRINLERYRASELFWVTRDMTRVAMDASSDIPPWIPATTVRAPTGLLVWAEPLPRLCWYGADHSPFVTADAVQWVHADGYVDINILTRTDQLVAEGHLAQAGRRGPFVKVRGVVMRAEEPTPIDQYVTAAEPGLIAALGATWTLMQIPTVANPRQITGAGGSGRQWQNQPRTVSIIDLRRLEHRDTAAADSAGRAYRHRWVRPRPLARPSPRPAAIATPTHLDTWLHQGPTRGASARARTSQRLAPLTPPAHIPSHRSCPHFCGDTGRARPGGPTITCVCDPPP